MKLLLLAFTLFLVGCNGHPLAPAPDFPDNGTPPVSTPVPTEHGFVVAQGRTFQNDGHEWQYHGATAFALFQRYLDGENITPLVLVYKDGGVNTLRVLGMWGFQDFNPARYGEKYWSSLGSFADVLAQNGMRLEFVVFADAQRILPNEASQQAHFNRVVATLSGRWNVFIELANEYSINGIDPRSFSRPTTASSAGSGPGGDVNGTEWDYATYHPNRPDNWYTVMWVPNSSVPLVIDEPMGAAEFNQPGRRDNNPDHFYQFGKLIYTLNVAGATFHSENGLYALPLGPTERECMTQLFKGMTGR